MKVPLLFESKMLTETHDPRCTQYKLSQKYTRQSTCTSICRLYHIRNVRIDALITLADIINNSSNR